MNRMKRIKYAIMVFYLALFAGLALYDETPDPELAREMARTLPETLEPGNAWVAILGFAAPAGVSPYAHGAQRMHKLQETVAAGRNSTEFLAATIDDAKHDLKFRGDMPSFYGRKDAGMLPYAAAHGREIAALALDNEELLRRYEALLDSPRFSEPLDYGFLTPMPGFVSLRSAQKARLLRLAVMADKGDMRGALAGVREDGEFWRLVARSSSTLISKLIAFASLTNDLRFAAELGSSRRLTAAEAQLVGEILRPFAADEATLASTIRGEARYGLRGMELSFRQDLKPWHPANLLFKPDATQNRMYADYQEFIRLAELPPRQFARTAETQGTEKTITRRIGLPFIYNPVGEILATIGAPGMQGYIAKGHSLEGLRRLAFLKVLASREQVPPERMGAFLASHGQDLGNPYSGGAMTWDGKKGAISFNGLSGEKGGELFL